MLNRVILIGRLTRDPEIRKTASGTAVSLALVVRMWRNSPAKALLSLCKAVSIRENTPARRTMSK